MAYMTEEQIDSRITMLEMLIAGDDLLEAITDPKYLEKSIAARATSKSINKAKYHGQAGDRAAEIGEPRRAQKHWALATAFKDKHRAGTQVTPTQQRRAALPA